jgi:hypothetical protein
LAAVQYTFTHKQYTEQYKKKGVAVGGNSMQVKGQTGGTLFERQGGYGLRPEGRSEMKRELLFPYPLFGDLLHFPEIDVPVIRADSCRIIQELH